MPKPFQQHLLARTHTRMAQGHIYNCKLLTTPQCPTNTHTNPCCLPILRTCVGTRPATKVCPEEEDRSTVDLPGQKTFHVPGSNISLQKPVAIFRATGAEGASVSKVPPSSVKPTRAAAATQRKGRASARLKSVSRHALR